MAGEKRQPSSSLCSLCSVEVSVALTTILHAHQARSVTPTNTHTHSVHAMERLILTSVIFTEAFRESNHESPAWKPECSLLCLAELLDGSLQHATCHTLLTLSPHFKRVTCRCRYTRITSHCQTFCNGITAPVALTVNELQADWCLSEILQRMSTAAGGASLPPEDGQILAMPTNWKPSRRQAGWKTPRDGMHW